MAADVINCTVTTVPSVSSFVADIGVNQENDLILIGVAWRVSGTIAISGYTSAAAKQNTDAVDSQWFVKIAGAGGESAPTVTTTGAAATGAFIVYVIRGADVSGTALNAIDAIGSTAGSVGAALTSHALTTASANCLVVHGAPWDSTNAIVDPADMNILGNIFQFSSGVTFKATAGTIPTFTWTGNTSTNTGRAWAVSIKNGTGNGDPVRLKDGRVWLQKLGGFTSPTVTAPNNYSTTTIATLATHTAASTVGTGQPSVNPWAFAGTKLTIATNLGADAWAGAYLSCASTNVSGKLCSFPYGFAGTVDNTRIGSRGNIIVLASSVGNWVAYQVLPQAKWKAQGFGVLTVKPGTTTAYASEGTVDLTAIVAIGYLHHRVAGATASIDVYVGLPVMESSASTFVGGGTAGNGSVRTEAMYLLGGTNVYAGACSFQGSGQLVNKFGVQYGDGTLATYINHQVQSYELPNSTDVQWRSGSSSAGVTIYAASGDTMDFSSSIFATESAQTFTIHASSSLSATYNFTNTTLQGWTVTDNAGIPWVSTAFKSGGVVTIAGGDLTNCTISKTTSTNAALAITANGSVLTSTSIIVADTSVTTAYHLELGTAVTAITLTDVTFTGTPGTDKVHVLATTGTVTITISGTTSLAAGDVTSAGATVVISAPLLYQTVTVSGATAGSRIQIYDTTSSTELYNGTPTFPYTWTDSVAAAANRAIRLRVSYVSGATAKEFIEASIGTCGQTSGTAAVSYLVNQVADTTYNSNAIDGPAIYATSGITFTDAATDRVNCNIGGGSVTYKTIYACFVYWNFTATGIANDFTYISAPDTANYLLSGMKIRNTSATDLSVTGGYGRDATSGASVDIIDTAGSTGNIFLAPDHVVAYATGSGVTAQDITDIAAATAAAVPSASTIATTTVGTAIDGTTTLAESIRIHNSVLAGKVSGAGTGTETFRDLADTKDRVVATVDTDGNRTAITRDAT